MIFLNNFTDLGVLSPGFSPGLITIGGNYIEGGTLVLEIDNTTPVTGFSQVRVGGTATLLPGSVFDVTLSSSADVIGNYFQVIANSAGGEIFVNGVLGALNVTISGGPGNSNAVLFDSGTGRIIITGFSPFPPSPPTPSAF